MMAQLILLLTGLALLQFLLMVLFLKLGFKNHTKTTKPLSWPKISVLIPARNEEYSLPACLKSLESLDYPMDKLEILLADDDSTDRTGEIIRSWVCDHPGRVEVTVGQEVFSHLNGKARVLSQMAEQATGDYFFFTDADCRPGSGWIKAMLSAYDEEQGLLVGFTAVKREGLWSRMQAVDWMLVLGIVKVLADRGKSLTAVGNNMMISRKAYVQVGGFPACPFSLTEDFEMARLMIKHGFFPAIQFEKNSRVETKSQETLAELLDQRKRWSSGAMDLPLYWKALLLMMVFFPVFCGLLFIWYGWISVGFYLVKLILQVIFIRGLGKKVDIRIPLQDLLIFELYFIGISWSTIVYYFWPSKVKWKERRY